MLLVSPYENDATGRGDSKMLLEAEFTARVHEVIFVTGDFDHARMAMIPPGALPAQPGLWVIHPRGYLCDAKGDVDANSTSIEIAEIRYFDFEDLPPDTDPGTVRRIHEIVLGAAKTESW